MINTSACLATLALLSASMVANAQQTPITETITFTADVTSSQGVNAGSVIYGSILYAPASAEIFLDALGTVTYDNLAPSVFSVVSNGSLSVTQPLTLIEEVTYLRGFTQGGIAFIGQSESAYLNLGFASLINPSASAVEGAPGSAINLSDWGSATFTYGLYNSVNDLLGQVTANVTSVNVAIPATAPEMDAGTAPAAIVLLLGGIAIIRGRRIAR